MSDPFDSIPNAKQSWAYQNLVGQDKEAAPRRQPRAVTASTNVNPLDREYDVDCAAGPVLLTLESAIGCAGRWHVFKKIISDVSTNAMIIEAAPGELIEGGLNVSSTLAGITFMAWSSGETWRSVVLTPGTPGPGTGAVTYTNATPVPITVGNIVAGSTFFEATMQQMWDQLLYGFEAPAFTSFAITGVSSPMAVGTSFGPGVTFTWTTSNTAYVVPDSIDIDDAGTPVVFGTANDGTHADTLGGAVTRTTAGTHVFNITGLDTIGGSFTLALTLQWGWLLYFGTNATPTLDETEIEALSSALASGYAGTYAMPAGGYKYICLAHAAGGQINSVTDANTLFTVPMAVGTFTDGGGFGYEKVSVTNAAVTTDYRVYRTFNSLGGAITLTVT